jgi:hypothetical protein
MKKLKLSRIFMIATLALCVACDLSGLLEDPDGQNSGLTESEVVAGLKDALSVGIDTASGQLSQVGGYLLNEAVKIMVPPDVASALDYADQFKVQIQVLSVAMQLAGIKAFDFSGFIGLRDSLTVSINRAAELAAPLSVDIFKTAITTMTIADGFTILRGDTTAATGYLKGRTFDPLTSLFEPFVDSTLELVNAQRYWAKLSTNYNSLVVFRNQLTAVLPGNLTSNLPPLPFESLTTDLSLYTTQKGLDGLFLVVGQQETLIRKDPVARVTEILRKVFGSL